MIRSTEIKKKAERLYEEVLRAVLTDKNIFPLDIRANKKTSVDFTEMWREMEELMSGSKDRKGYGFSVISQMVNTRSHGKQSIPQKIIFESQNDYLSFLGKTSEFEDFTHDCNTIFTAFSQLKPLFIQNPLIIVKNQGKWQDLLKVCSWFVYNYQPNAFYIRELPISIHTKFIEENKSVLNCLLDVLIPAKIRVGEKDFEKKFGLCYKEPLLRFRLIDKTINSFLPWEDISLPVSQFAAKPIACKNIFIVENEMNFLTFPKVENSIVLWGKGFAVESLKGIAWLWDKSIYYWSDLDTQGFQMLSQLRSYYPQTVSILMSKQVLDDFSGFIVKGTPTPVSECKHLYNEEKDVYDYLRTNNLRLEQERVTQRYLKKVIDGLE